MGHSLVAGPRSWRPLGLCADFVKGVEGPLIARCHSWRIPRSRPQVNRGFICPQTGAFSQRSRARQEGPRRGGNGAFVQTQRLHRRIWRLRWRFPGRWRSTKIARRITLRGHRFLRNPNFLANAMTGHFECLSLEGQRGARFIQQQNLRRSTPTWSTFPGRGLENLIPHAHIRAVE